MSARRPGRGAALRGLAGAGAGALLLAAAGPSSAVGQTPFTALGLGYPVAPVDARAAGMGSTGVGLLDGSFTLRNPAEIAAHEGSALAVTLAPEGVDVEGGGRPLDSGRSRVSVIRAVSRMGPVAVAVGFGSELDQDFTLRLSDTLVTTVGRFPVEETREHDGGVSAIDVSLAGELGPVMLGVGVQRLTGNLRQSIVRRFEADVDTGLVALRDADASARLSYGGWRVRAGAALRIGRRAQVGGTFGLTGDLDAEVDTLAPAEAPNLPTSRIFEMPADAEVGASVRIHDRLLLSVAGGWVGWSVLDGSFEGVEVDDVRWGGGGLEFRGLEVLGFEVPLRLGGRFGDLPFYPEGGEQPTERAVSVGVGARFRPGRGAPAEVNAALELGSRGDLEDVGLEESFQRLVIGFVIRT